MDFKTELDLFICNVEKNLLEVSKKFGWGIQSSQSQETPNVQFQYCPIKKEHRVPENKMKDHLEKCKLKSQGYSVDDTFLQPLDEDMLKNHRVIVMDKYKQQKILSEASKRNRKLNISTHLREPPLTFDRYLCEFTSDERYVLYDYAIQQTSSQVTSSQQDGFNLGFEDIKSKQKECPQTLQDLLAAERDAKRRRQAHRKKNPQGGRKSDTETFRELIQSQMEHFYNKKDDNIFDKKNDQPNIKWRYGKRLNVQNYYRQWEIIGSEHYTEKINIKDRKNTSSNDDGRYEKHLKSSDHEQNEKEEEKYDDNKRKRKYDTTQRDSMKKIEYIRSKDKEDKKKPHDKRHEDRHKTKYTHDKRYEDRHRTKYTHGDEYREQTKNSYDKQYEGKSYDRKSSKHDDEHRDIRSKTYKRKHKRKSHSKSPECERNSKKSHSRSPFEKYEICKKKVKKSRSRSKGSERIDEINDSRSSKRHKRDYSSFSS